MEAGARRIDDGNELGAVVLVEHGLDVVLDLADDELDVLHVVARRVSPCVDDGRLAQLDADDVLGVGGHGNANGSRAAAQVEDDRVAVDGGHLADLGVEDLGAARVDLEKGLGRDVKAQVVQALADDGRAGQVHGRVVRHGRLGHGVVDDPVDRGDLCAVAQVQVLKSALERVALGGDDGRVGALVGDGGEDHDFAVGRRAHAQQAPEALVGPLVVRRQLGLVQQPLHGRRGRLGR